MKTQLNNAKAAAYLDKQYAKLEKGFVKYEDLCRVVRLDPHTDNERFSTLPVIGSGVIGRYTHNATIKDMENAAPNIIVRETVYRKLLTVDAALKRINKNWQLLVLCGYRSLEIQETLFDDEYNKLKPQHTGQDELELLEAVHRAVAVPHVAGHPTGAAVDVTIYDAQAHAELDFGTAPIDFSTKKRYYDAFQLSKHAKKNRTLLRRLMCEQGFVPFDGEWWHFSYGDKEWAFYTYRQQIRGAGKHELPEMNITHLYGPKRVTEIAYSDKYRLSEGEPVGHDRLRLAIEKNNRIVSDVLTLLERAGIEVVAESDKVFGKCRNFPLDLLFVSGEDIPQLVESGVVDIGIVGQYVCYEQQKQNDCPTLMTLGLGHCSLALAVPTHFNIRTVRELTNKTIATAYPHSTRSFLKEMGVEDITLLNIHSSVEVAPATGYADAIVDLVATGNTLRQNNLRHLQTIYESQAVLITNNTPPRQAKKYAIDKLLQRFESCLLAGNYKSLSFRCTQSQATTAAALLGVQHATQLQCARNNQFAMQCIIEKSTLWDTVDKLKADGVEKIFIFDVEGFIR
jgi:ATP phosphoribosyltransferase